MVISNINIVNTFITHLHVFHQLIWPFLLNKIHYDMIKDFKVITCTGMSKKLKGISTGM